MENIEQQQLALISEMISVARKEYDDDSYIYLLWGWSVCLASLAEFVLLRMGKAYHSMVWLAMPFVAIVQFILMRMKRKAPRVRTYLDKITGYVWIAVGVCIGVVLVSSYMLQEHTYPVLILLYGIGTFISGGILKHRSMIWGGVGCWVIGFATFYFPFEYQLLLLSLSLIVAYIIPGHLLKLRERKHV